MTAASPTWQMQQLLVLLGTSIEWNSLVGGVLLLLYPPRSMPSRSSSLLLVIHRCRCGATGCGLEVPGSTILSSGILLLRFAMPCLRLGRMDFSILVLLVTVIPGMRLAGPGFNLHPPPSGVCRLLPADGGYQCLARIADRASLSRTTASVASR